MFLECSINRACLLVPPKGAFPRGHTLLVPHGYTFAYFAGKCLPRGYALLVSPGESFHRGILNLFPRGRTFVCFHREMLFVWVFLACSQGNMSSG